MFCSCIIAPLFGALPSTSTHGINNNKPKNKRKKQNQKQKQNKRHIGFKAYPHPTG
jgi:hypothetical protein